MVLDFTILLENLMEILTLVIALGAIITAFLSYTYRPTKLDVVKRHSEDLKEKIIKRWIKQIQHYTPKNPYEPKANDKCGLNLQVERELYFDDIKNHLPSELKLLKEWYDYKDKWKKYEKERSIFFSEIKENLSNEIGLIYDNKEIKNNYFAFSLINNVFSRMETIDNHNKRYVPPDFKGREQGDGTIRYSDNGATLFRGDKEQCDRALKKFENYVEDIKEKNYFIRLKELNKQYKIITKQREELIKKLRFIDFIPLLPGKCKYIRWSLPGIIERIKKRL